MNLLQLSAFACLVCHSGMSAVITMESLLDEITDRDSLACMPAVRCRNRLWSSYERKSIAPDRPGWFANTDSSNFLRTEKNANGRIERVLVDAEGPGAVVRFWITLDRVPLDAVTLRFYIDGADKPAIEGNAVKILSCGGLCEAPLSDSVSPKTPLKNRGHNLYLPIPYARRCKVTVEYDAPGARFYYNVETRAWEKGTQVESFSSNVLARAAGAIAKANAILAAGTGDPLPPGTERRRRSGFSLKPGEEFSETFTGPGAIREISAAITENKWRDSTPLMRDMSIRLEFDGETTVDMPLPHFFGAGDAPTGFMTRNMSDTCPKADSHLLTARWTMPYAKSAKVVIRNCSGHEFRPDAVSISAGPYSWNPARSMHFAATYVDRAGIRTRKNGTHRDLNYFTAKDCEGLFVGCAVSVFNTARTWWGEGDEKIYVDGETFPSFFGTGTEDHYGYAWCRGEPFSHPFISQPDGSGNMAPGQAVNIRTRALDAIPFHRSISYDMELWHWSDCRIDYRTVAWCYLR